MSRKKTKRQKHKERSALKKNEGDHQVNDKRDRVVVSGKIEIEFPQNIVDKYDTREEKTDTREGKKFKLELATVLGIFLAAAITFAQACLISQSNQISRDSLHSVQRAFLTLRDVPNTRLQHLNGWFWDFNAIWENSGVTPADGVINSFAIGKIPSGDLTEKQFRGNDVSEWNTVTIGPKVIIGAQTLIRDDKLFFGQELGDLTQLKTPLPEPPSEPIYFYGWAMYKDIFFPEVEIHLTEFCFRYTSATMSNDHRQVKFNTETCKEHNCTDRHCPDYEEMVKIYPK